MPPQTDYAQRCTVGWIAPMALELTVAIGMLDEHETLQVPRDDAAYPTCAASFKTSDMSLSSGSQGQFRAMALIFSNRSRWAMSLWESPNGATAEWSITNSAHGRARALWSSASMLFIPPQLC
ncbi:hypothetical protein B0T14DRAFT_158226 [Immersiella caudata]|uniref:Uncharacterized protein n=1 Tax=Immersiella caudata TaxID=314043 RepID=A0AA39WWM0_9PEZI|nr:hypothetical protein B0T14DRAFT_158226 [Immersiella caudata]